MAQTRLAKLVLQNFKSVPFASIDFSEMNFWVGRNGSGKSNIADAFAFLSEAMEQPLQSVINRRGGAHNVAHRRPIHAPNAGPNRIDKEVIPLGFAVEFSSLPFYQRDSDRVVRARYAVEISTSRRGFSVSKEQCFVQTQDGKIAWFERNSFGIRTNIEYLKGMPANFISEDSLMMQIFGGIIDFAFLKQAIISMAVYSIEPSTLREFQDHDPGTRLLPDGSNSASVLDRLSKASPAQFKRLLEIMASIIPDLEEVRSVAVGRKQSLRFYQGWYSKEFGRERLFFDAFNMSDGTLRSFGILLAIFQNPRPSLILIEEPETSIHPGATSALLELLRSVSADSQVVVTTHSPEVLDHAISEDVIRVVSWHRGSTRVDGIYGAAKEALRKDLCGAGELFRMRILDAPSIFDTEVIRAPLFEVLE
ncbi:AAA family ATPase [Granulicella sp. dw_53]|uniref:AAA family ATPase n=1 Tax=Granulicella sp. dw_53 TaxID=2719792 RepID=UPI001BD21FD8|nr:AAA family ATPase [Granulicella sp. dw_53]